MVRILRTVFLLLFLLTGSPVAAQTFETEAPYAFLVDAETGTVLFSKNADTPFPPASLAKLMTIEVIFNALEQGRVTLDQPFDVSENAWRTGGAPSGTSTMFAEVNSTVPLEALLKGIIVQSANDGCIAIAEGMAGSEKDFAKLMTKRARAIGLEQSTFVNSTGLPAEGQQVTAREMTRLAMHLWREYPEYYEHFAQPDFEWNGILQRNRNPMLTLEIGADGLKTGYTEDSGYSIVVSAATGERRLFATLSGLSGTWERVQETRRLLDWGMNNFEKREVFTAGESVGEAEVYGGTKSKLALHGEGVVSTLLPVDQETPVTGELVYQGPLEAPIEKGTQIGTLEVQIDEATTQSVPLYAAETIPPGKLHQRAFDAARELLIGWMR